MADTGDKIARESWNTPTLDATGAFAQHSTDKVQYFKDADGCVHIRGKAVKASPAAGDTIFTLPAGYRPTQAANCSAVGNVGAADVFGAVLIGTDGTVKYRAGGASTYIDLTGITLRANF